MENKKNEIKLFEDHEIRTIWNEEIEDYYFSVVDVIQVLTESKNPTQYWRTFKSRLKSESNETVTNCNALKMKSKDGKMRLTDVADTKQILRIIQSIPSPNAEPFKQWLAEIGKERLDEIADPEKAIERAVDIYRKKGYSEDWISQRLKAIDIRHDMTSEWKRSGIEQGAEYAILTDEVNKAWTDMSTKQYKQHKNLKKENLRDNMTNT